MPKPNKTMLDQLASMMKAYGGKKPAIIQETAWQDPLSGSIVGRKVTSLTPNRQMYQEGIDARLFPKMRKADELVSDRYDDMDLIKDEWTATIDEAKESMREDWESGLDYQEFDNVDPNYLEVDAPATDLREYWPYDRRTPEEIYDDYDAAQDAYYAAKDEQRRLRSPQARMLEQTMTPRYRNYQRAMMQRAENARLGRLNAAIMNLARQGYSLPEIREILKNQRIR